MPLRPVQVQWYFIREEVAVAEDAGVGEREILISTKKSFLGLGTVRKKVQCLVDPRS